MISELGIMGIIGMICATIFAISWILLPFLVSAVQRSTYNCSRELRALNSRMDLIISKIFFESKEPKELSPHDTINSTTTDGKIT
jgi:predicted RND superfamily exporter protein